MAASIGWFISVLWLSMVWPDSAVQRQATRGSLLPSHPLWVWTLRDSILAPDGRCAINPLPDRLLAVFCDWGAVARREWEPRAFPVFSAEIGTLRTSILFRSAKIQHSYWCIVGRGRKPRRRFRVGALSKHPQYLWSPARSHYIHPLRRHLTRELVIL